MKNFYLKGLQLDIWKTLYQFKLPQKNLVWPDETNQDHSSDLMEQSAMCQIWLMCPFRNLGGDLIPTSTDKSSPEDPIANTSCGKIFLVNIFFYFALELRWYFFVQPLHFDLVWIVLSWPKDVIYDRTLLLLFKMSNILSAGEVISLPKLNFENNKCNFHKPEVLLAINGFWNLWN